MPFRARGLRLRARFLGDKLLPNACKLECYLTKILKDNQNGLQFYDFLHGKSQSRAISCKIREIMYDRNIYHIQAV